MNKFGILKNGFKGQQYLGSQIRNSFHLYPMNKPSRYQQRSNPFSAYKQVRFGHNHSSRTDLGVDPGTLLLDSFYSLCFLGTISMVLTGGYVLYVSGSLDSLAADLAIESNKILQETYSLELMPTTGTVAHSIANPPPSLLQQAATFLVGYEAKYLDEERNYQKIESRSVMETLEYWNAILSVKFAIVALKLIDLVPKDPFPPLPSSYKSSGTHVQIQYQITNFIPLNSDPSTILEDKVVEAIKNPIQTARGLRRPEHKSSQVSKFINATVHSNLTYKGKLDGWSVENIVVDFANGSREYPYGFERPKLVPAGPRQRKGWFF